MPIFKKVMIDVLFAFIFFLIALMFATAVKLQNPDCVTCGANTSITFWSAAMLSLQPVLWTSGIKKMRRFLIWLIGVLTGGIMYIILETTGAVLLGSGKAIGLNPGFYANYVFYVAALIISLLAVRFTKRRTENRSSTKQVENQKS